MTSDPPSVTLNDGIEMSIPRVDVPAPEPKLRIVPPHWSPTPGAADYFTGAVAVTSPFKGTGGARLGGATVTFQPGAHTNWHTHPLGQLLVVTDGKGWVQLGGEPAQPIKAGDTVWIGPGVKHWHGAARETAMTHVAVSEALDGTSVTWLEPVSDEHYNALR
ncbi:cupin domain-containing protein [Sphingomonas crusticola]|uniref:(R)-mandelonitrile lyase n=1 Tax=Sphingomonas crusticola TaxID=1697973 RepID=UPI001F07463D|nr:cupin domain-containing protein [Sphingomonas crusticola]